MINDDDDVPVNRCVTYYNERMECRECHRNVYTCNDCKNPICFSETCKNRYIRAWNVRLDPCYGHDFCKQCKKVVICSSKECQECKGM